MNFTVAEIAEAAESVTLTPEFLAELSAPLPEGYPMPASLKIVKQPHELVQVGKKTVSVFGYRNDLAEEHLRWHLTQMSNKWCSVDCMAHVMFGRRSEENRSRVRRRVGQTFKFLLLRSRLFLVIEYDDSAGGHGKIKAMKLYEAGSGIEGQYALHQIDRMAQRQQMSEEMRVQALVAIGCPRP